MTTDGVNRRQVLRSLAATAVAASAGCLSGGDNGTPEYAKLVPAAEDGVTFAYLRYDITERTGGDSPRVLPILFPAPNTDERSVELPDRLLGSREDPLLSFVFGTGGWLLTAASFAFLGAGLGSLVGRRSPGTVEELFVAGGVTMGTGAFDTEDVGQQLRTETAAAGSETYEFVEETDTFRFYERQGDTGGRGAETAAVSKNRILFGRDRDGIERLVETARGERASAADRFDGFDWLADTAGDGSLVTGRLGPLDVDDPSGDPASPSPSSIFRRKDNVVSTLNLNPGADEISVDLAVHTDSLSPDRRDALEATFLTGSHETSISPENGQFSVSGTFNEIPFQPVQADWTDDLPSGDSLPPEIQEAVPEGAVEISEAPDREGKYQVEVVEEIQVDEITVRAIIADRETTTDPDSLNRLLISPNLDDDEIRVVVTVDGVSGIIATEEVP